MLIPPLDTVSAGSQLLSHMTFFQMFAFLNNRVEKRPDIIEVNFSGILVHAQ